MNKSRSRTVNKELLEPLYDYQFRLILIGDSTVGKSSLLRYFTDGKFSEICDTTVGVDFYSRLVSVEDGRRIKLQLWDTAGQEKFRSITKSYYRNSVGAILAYDITSKATFDHIPGWINEAKKYIEPHCPVFLLIGCKADLADSAAAPAPDIAPDDVNCHVEPSINRNRHTRQVPPTDVTSFCSSNGNINYIETSSKTGLNVQEAFQMITQDIYNKIMNGEFTLSEQWDGIKIGPNQSGSSTIMGQSGSLSISNGRNLPLATPVNDSACCL